MRPESKGGLAHGLCSCLGGFRHGKGGGLFLAMEFLRLQASGGFCVLCCGPEAWFDVDVGLLCGFSEQAASTYLLGVFVSIVR